MSSHCSSGPNISVPNSITGRVDHACNAAVVPTVPSSSVPPYSPIPAALHTAATSSAPNSPPALPILRATEPVKPC